MSKGISPVIASIILILIVISLAGSFVVFTGRLTSSQTEAAEKQSQQATRTATTIFHIEGVSGRTVTLVNDGLQTLAVGSVAVSIDDRAVNYTMAGDIAPKERGDLTVQGLWSAGRGDHRLTVRGAAGSDSIPITIESVKEEKVLDLRFDEGTGTAANDVSGNANTGSLGSGNSSRVPAWVAGKFGKALQFDGVDDGVSIADSTSLRFTKEFTAEMWVKPTNLAVGQKMLIEKTNANTNGWTFYKTSPNTSDVQFEFPNINNEGLLAANALSNGAWSHIVLTVKNRVGSIYTNGDLEISRTWTVDGIVSTDALWIGSRAGSGLFFDGTIDELRVYTIAYAPDELYVMKRR